MKVILPYCLKDDCQNNVNLNVSTYLPLSPKIQVCSFLRPLMYPYPRLVEGFEMVGNPGFGDACTSLCSLSVGDGRMWVGLMEDGKVVLRFWRQLMRMKIFGALRQNWDLNRTVELLESHGEERWSCQGTKERAQRNPNWTTPLTLLNLTPLSPSLFNR